MAVELNAANVHPNALNLTPRQIFGLWITWKRMKPRRDLEEANVMRWAQAPDEEWKKAVANGRI
jgi:hypothetical protein